MKQKTNGMQADNCKSIETKKATRRAASKNTAEVDALRKLATAMIGTTLQWPNGTQYRLASFEKVTKNKVTFWLSEPPCHHGVSVMDISRTMLEHLQATGEHRTDCGTTVTVNREAEKPLAYIAYCRGVAQDIFTDWGEAVADLSRHVYNTLRDCCGGEVSKESESRYQVYFKEADEWEVCEVSPIDLNRPQDREAYKAQRERLGLPALENSGEITEANALQEASEIKPKAAFQIGDRVERKSDGERGTVDGYDVTDGNLTYIVKYDRTQRRQSDGFEYLTEEVFAEEIEKAKKESFGKMFIYRLYIKWKWMQQRFERIGDMDRAADCFYHRLRLTKLYIYQPGWRIMDYGDMKPIFFPRQRIK